MATLEELALQPPGPIKLLYIGDSGAGKTGSLASLAKAGFKLRILDYDGGARILLDPSILPVEFRKNVEIETCQDRYKTHGGRVFPESSTAWMKGAGLLNNWPPHGHISTWGTEVILVLDSLTFAGKSAMNFHMSLNGKLATPPTWQDFKHPQGYIDNFLSLLYSDAVRCNVIVITHIDYAAPPGTTREEREKQDLFRGYPTAGAGSALGPRLGRFFNDVLLARTDGSTRQIHTTSRDSIELKTARPGAVKRTYPLATGLSEYFASVRGELEATPAQPLAVA